ncbi:MAG TPA: hypothetical protein VK083_06960 [Nocardia sp.]|uniref:hypothetical protein n=1 Tax=Nocardia sp. TaxID=1821 RepID=UPI002B4B319B|nr:hypothetical protein [Nocardia sp.]HLS76512.1 hypothetical protein [Nocardia sp.]
MIRIGGVVRVARVLTAATALAVVAVSAAACGDGGEAAVSTAAAASGPSEAGLRAAAEEWSKAIAEGDYAAAYGFRSARCRLTIGQDAYVEELSQRYAGRDLAGAEPEITVAVTGETGQVSVRYTDERAGEDDTAPATWKFVDGSWRYDTC